MVLEKVLCVSFILQASSVFWSIFDDWMKASALLYTLLLKTSSLSSLLFGGGSLVYPTYVKNVPILVPFHLTEVTRSHCITFRYWRTNLVILSSWMMKPLNIALDTSDEHFTRPVAYYKRWKFHKTSCLLQEVFECFQMNYMDSWKWYMNLAHTSIVLFVNISSKGI